MARKINLSPFPFKLGREQGKNPVLAPEMRDLANALGLNGGVRSANPLAGDIVFFDHTYDRDKSCSLGDDKQPTHVGIVERVLPTGPVDVLHAATNGVWFARMNVATPSTYPANDFLTNRFCVSCKSGESCPGVKGCSAGSKPRNPNAKCSKSDFDDYGHLTGELFSGYATIRDIPKP